jgi:hypothetical protein
MANLTNALQELRAERSRAQLHVDLRTDGRPHENNAESRWQEIETDNSIFQRM